MSDDSNESDSDDSEQSNAGVSDVSDDDSAVSGPSNAGPAGESDPRGAFTNEASFFEPFLTPHPSSFSANLWNLLSLLVLLLTWE